MDATDPYDFISTSSSRTSLSSPVPFDCFGNNVEFTMELEAPSLPLPLVILTDTASQASRKSAVVSMYSVLAPKDETLYHNNMPVYCVEEKAVGPDDAVRQAYRCPSKYVCKYAPAGLVRENYCFVVDGRSVPLESLVGDEAYWKPTGRPAHYVFTEDFVNFQSVRIMVFRGKIINAKIKTTSSSKGSAGSSPKRIRHKEVPLNHVYKICRYYSYWRTCPHYHRIITVISPIKAENAGSFSVGAPVTSFKNNNDGSGVSLFSKTRKSQLGKSSSTDFQQRFFVQYLWAGSREKDKAKVAEDFTTSNQLLSVQQQKFDRRSNSMLFTS